MKKQYRTITENQSRVSARTVTVNANGAEISFSTCPVITNKILPAYRISELNNLTRTNFTLVGWYLDPTFTQSYNLASQTVSEDTILYAKWTGEEVYDIAGTYSWTCPEGVNSVDVTCIGAGGSATQGSNRGAGGAGLGWKNSISVIPGNTYTLVVGAPGASATVASGSSYFINTSTVAGHGGNGSQMAQALGGTYIGDGGGNGGRGWFGSGSWIGGAGGAGGYAGNGGDGSNTQYGSILETRSEVLPVANSGGASGGQAREGTSTSFNTGYGYAGGGTGINGIGTTAALRTGGGAGGSGGSNSDFIAIPGNAGPTPGEYGGGAVDNLSTGSTIYPGGKGAVRIKFN